MAETSTLTIITPSLNQGQFLEQTICSVLDQGYPNLQYLVVDGGSTDASLHILDRYSDQVTCLARTCTDPGEAINAALPYATGELVGVLGSDDLYLPGALETVAEAWQHAGRPDWLAGSCEHIGLADEPIGELHASAPSSLAPLLKHDEGHFPLAGTFYRNDLLQRFGGFSENLGSAFDYEMACRLIADGHHPTIVPTMVGAVRQHPSSRSALRTIEQGQAYITAAEHYADHLPLAERYALWANCEQRRRIFAIAEAEAAGSDAKRRLWQRLLRHPWWLADEHYRKALLSGSRHAPDELATTPAA